MQRRLTTRPVHPSFTRRPPAQNLHFELKLHWIQGAVPSRSRKANFLVASRSVHGITTSSRCFMISSEYKSTSVGSGGVLSPYRCERRALIGGRRLGEALRVNLDLNDTICAALLYLRCKAVGLYYAAPNDRYNDLRFSDFPGYSSLPTQNLKIECSVEPSHKLSTHPGGALGLQWQGSSSSKIHAP